MSISITENDNVIYENEPDIERTLFPNEKTANDALEAVSLLEEKVDDNSDEIDGIKDEIDGINNELENKIDNTFIKQSGTLNDTTFTFEVPNSYSCGVIVANINGVGNQCGWYNCSNGTVTITRFDAGTVYLSATYDSDTNTITITNTQGTSIRDITIILG